MTRVAIQGEPGCFSHAAAVHTFGVDVEVVPRRDFAGLFDAVLSGEAAYGAVPVENTLAGAVVENLDLLHESPVRVTHEAYVRVELCLVAATHGAVEALTSAASHPVALRQCRTFFQEHPRISPVPVYDTAGSIRDLMRGGTAYHAAIGPALAAKIYGGEILVRGIEDNARNFTRFFMVSSGSEAGPEPSASRKTSVSFTLAHEPGSLHHALGILAEHGLDLTRLESRPIPGRPWEYRFYADVRCGSGDDCTRAFERLAEEAAEFHVFGSYEEVPVP